MEINLKRITALAAGSALALGLATASAPAAACSDQPYMGTLCLVAFTFCPKGYAEANGQLLAISSNTALFSLLGTTYGGNGTTTFALPDLRGRSAVGEGQGPGLSPIKQGQVGGAEQVTLTIQTMPSHNHTATLKAVNAAGNQDLPAGHTLASLSRTNLYSDAQASSAMGASSIDVGYTGGGQPHENRPPYLGLRYCIATVGLYPPRP